MHEVSLYLLYTGGCKNSTIRMPLLGGAVISEGLVEVCINGTYYPVSLDSGRFSVREATVICKELGLGNGDIYYIQKCSTGIPTFAIILQLAFHCLVQPCHIVERVLMLDLSVEALREMFPAAPSE